MAFRAILACGSVLMALSPVMVVGARIRPNGDPNTARVIWADPFDNYSQWAWDNRSNPAYPNGTLWQGGPMPAGSDVGAYPRKSDNGTATPDNGCGVLEQSLPSKHLLARQQWTSNPCGNIHTPTGFVVGECTFFAGPDAFKPDSNCSRWGWVETIGEFGRVDSVWQHESGYYTSLNIFTHELVSRVQSFSPLRAWDEPNPNAVQGTDEHPLTLIFYLDDSGNPLNARSILNNGYVELNLDDEHAPTDYIWRGKRDKTYESGDPECCVQGPYPIICQQKREVNEGNLEQAEDLQYLNDHCPSLVPPFDPQAGTGKTWPAIAFGFLAIGSKDPCTCMEQGVGAHIPTMNHPMLFDGNVWRELRNGRGTALAECPPSWGPGDPKLAGPETMMQDSGTGSCGDFSLGGGSHMVYLKLTTNRILIWMRTKNSDDSPNDYCGAFDRVYKGAFNRVAVGVGPGCELQDKATQGDSYSCKVGGTPKRCLTYASNTTDGPSPQYTDGYWRTQLDSMSLLDGVLVHHTYEGACCMSNGSCTIMLDTACATAGGSFMGAGTFCDACNGACCQPRGVCTETTVNACPGIFHGYGSQCGTDDRLCCPTPFADWDQDHDMDVDDFGILQKCLTIGGGQISAGCICFDHNDDGQIDQTDLESFLDCATGPAVVTESPIPGCTP